MVFQRDFLRCLPSTPKLGEDDSHISSTTETTQVGGIRHSSWHPEIRQAKDSSEICRFSFPTTECHSKKTLKKKNGVNKAKNKQ